MEHLGKVEQDFLHHLRDTIILLGGGTDIADLLKGEINESDVDRLRQFNVSLIDATKHKLVSINKGRIFTTPTN